MAKTERIRLLSTSNVLDKRFKTFDHFDGIFREVLGTPERYGIWLVYGKEKNGKTWTSLMLASALSKAVNTLYVSAEEGISMNFRDTLRRINANYKNRRLFYSEYLEVERIEELLKRKKGRPGAIVIDNITFYADELKNGTVRRLQREYPNVLWVFIGHEDKGDVYTATGKLIRKLAKVIIRVEGLRVIVGGRCPGGEFDIDQEKADLYYGQRA